MAMQQGHCHESLVEAYGEMILPYRTARTHTAHPVADLYHRWEWQVIYHLLHSLDLSPCDYDLVPKMKETLRDFRLQTVTEILLALRWSVRNINTTGAATGILRLVSMNALDRKSRSLPVLC
ncbi:hypothetical protein L9F63_016774 [Diploptera punctata]|uniref:Uncharacterized protein n=1 Tax=Diploptera punctata TaxID=6984 RepID=A0AAD8EGV5_DIPPU|nr:hypothetical protein L9F63_016774 [Diploptera punctata]